MRPSPTFSILSAIALSAMAMGRSVTVTNKCPFTIWPAIFTGPGGPVPDYTTGWEASASTSVTFSVPDNWQAGRIWGRRDCDFSVDPGPNSCVDGGCNGGLVCTYGGVPPTTLAEFTLSGSNNLDYYDISLVQGFNLPLEITNTAGCPVASCPVDLDPNCPDVLKGPFDSSGNPVGCKSYCEVDPNPTNSPSCCTGSYSTADTCPNSTVLYYSYFKSNCPNAYAYAYDESSGTALWTCPTSSNADYTITFCP